MSLRIVVDMNLSVDTKPNCPPGHWWSWSPRKAECESSPSDLQPAPSQRMPTADRAEAFANQTTRGQCAIMSLITMALTSNREDAYHS